VSESICIHIKISKVRNFVNSPDDKKASLDKQTGNTWLA